MSEKEKILSKFNIKDYITELELILEQKEFDEEAKSLLLSIFYKLDNFYKDYSTVKKETENKNKYLENYIDIIKNKCNKIKILSTLEFMDNEKIKIDKINKTITVFPNEIILLYALNELSEKSINDLEIDFTNKCIIDLLNKGRTINNTEPIRDFNGWSWNVQMENINNIEYNIIYQNLLMLFGLKFVDDLFVTNNITKILKEQKHSEIIKQKYYDILEILFKISIILYNNESEENHNNCIDYKNSIIHEIELLNNRKEYINKISKENSGVIKKIQDIDLILNDIKLIRKEFERNIQDGNNQYFCISDFVDRLENDRIKYLNKIEDNNKSISPKQYLRTQDKFRQILNLYKLVDNKYEKINVQNLILKLQILFLEYLELKISKINNKKELYNMIVDLRYYANIYYNNEKKLIEIESIKKIYEKICNLVIIKSVEMKLIDLGFRTKKLNIEILKYIFKTKIMKLDNLTLKLTYEEPRTLNIEYLDVNMLDHNQKFEIPLEEDISNKKERKIKLFKIGG